MCNRYVSPTAGDIERYWHVGARTPWRGAEVFPRGQGPFIRAQRETEAPERELVIGQWGLVPWFAKTPKLPYSTNNARFEEITSKASFKHSWQYGKRCIIPACSFDEPNWETGKNVWWRFQRADGTPWGLAGLWNTWTDKASGEIVESYTMLSLAEMDAAIEAIRKQIAGFEEIQTSATTVVKGGEKIYKRAAVMSEEIERRLLVLQEQASRLRMVGGGN